MFISLLIMTLETSEINGHETMMMDTTVKRNIFLKVSFIQGDGVGGGRGQFFVLFLGQFVKFLSYQMCLH